MKQEIICVQSFHDLNAHTDRTAGDMFVVQDDFALRLFAQNLARPVTDTSCGVDWPWTEHIGAELVSGPVEPPQWDRIVVGLNVWNDIHALVACLPTWIDEVDHVIAVDGAYLGAPVPQGHSTDGTLMYLEQQPKVSIVASKDAGGFWKDQPTKRNVYFDNAHPNDLLVILDADEKITRLTPGGMFEFDRNFDVGWMWYDNPLYTKISAFPRIYRIGAFEDLSYAGRHYWVHDGDMRITDCQHSGSGFDHHRVPILLSNNGKQYRDVDRRNQRRIIKQTQAKVEAKVGNDPPTGRECLRILQMGALDPGMVIFRLHSAINSTTPNTSIMATAKHERAYEEPYQYDFTRERSLIQEAVRTSDILHCHLGFTEMDMMGVRIDTPVVIHHHGTMLRRNPDLREQQDHIRKAIRLVSNPELLQYGDDLYYLPNPVPVRQYERMTEGHQPPWKNERPWRIGHSPSKRENKGTEDFLEVMDELNNKYGLNTETVLIEHQAFESGLVSKATCDIFFDSFWLGMQCSGLEAAAMRIPVIAGDKDNLTYHKGDPPYVYANTKQELMDRIVLLMDDEGEYRFCQNKVFDYVQKYHDYAAVASRYLDILQATTRWRNRLALGQEPRLTINPN